MDAMGDYEILLSKLGPLNEQLRKASANDACVLTYVKIRCGQYDQVNARYKVHVDLGDSSGSQKLLSLLLRTVCPWHAGQGSITCAVPSLQNSQACTCTHSYMLASAL
jgi:hypothetical protein